jgi:hypothetical protein
MTQTFKILKGIDKNNAGRGLCFGPKMIFIPPSPPGENYIISPPCNTLVFYSYSELYDGIFPNFAFSLLFYFPFSHFLPLS